MAIRSAMLAMAATSMLFFAMPPGEAAASDQGRFVVNPPFVESEEMRIEARRMQQTGLLQELAAGLNTIFVLPRDISLRYAECDEANAFYDADSFEILMCLELMQGMAEILDGQFEDEETARDALAGAYLATALHEVGHALVHVLEIPVTGREEDAVDQLAAWMLIKADDVDSVLGAAAVHYTDEDLAEADLSGEHALDGQRYFNMVCWAYGSDPENSQALIEQWELPPERAAQCADEYKQLDRSWTRLLAGHLRDDSARLGNGLAAPLPTSVAQPQTAESRPVPELPTAASGGRRQVAESERQHVVVRLSEEVFKNELEESEARVPRGTQTPGQLRKRY